MDKSDTIKGGADNLKPLDSPDKIKGVTNYIEQSAIMEILYIMEGLFDFRLESIFPFPTDMRRLFSYHCNRLGVRISTISKVLGKHRATVKYYIESHKDLYYSDREYRKMSDDMIDVFNVRRQKYGL